MNATFQVEYCIRIYIRKTSSLNLPFYVLILVYFYRTCHPTIIPSVQTVFFFFFFFLLFFHVSTGVMTNVYTSNKRIYMFPKFQSGFRRYHSTETAVLRVLSDIYSAIDQDQVSLLALLDISAAFDTVDHGILLERLSTSYGLSGMAYTWLESYITGRAQIVHVGNHHSSPSKVLYSVPQGSVLGPVLYVLYTSDVAKLVEALGLGTHLYADDTQLYGHCSPSNSVELASRVLRAIDSIHEWMSSNRLSLNTSKTQFIWLGAKHSLAKRDTDRLSSLHPSLTELTSVRNLGFIIDQELSMKDHITKLSQSCYYQLRQIRAVRHSLTQNCHPNLGPRLRLHTRRFCKQPPLWDKRVPPWPSPVGPQLCCTFDPQNRQIRSDLVCNSTGPPLASNPFPCPFQAQFHHEQLPGWSSTGVLDWALPFREWHSSEAQPSVIIPGPAPGSSISEGTIGSQRFLRFLTTAMESPSCRYPTSPRRTSTF